MDIGHKQKKQACALSLVKKEINKGMTQMGTR